MTNWNYYEIISYLFNDYENNNISTYFRVSTKSFLLRITY